MDPTKNKLRFGALPNVCFVVVASVFKMQEQPRKQMVLTGDQKKKFNSYIFCHSCWCWTVVTVICIKFAVNCCLNV